MNGFAYHHLRIGVPGVLGRNLIARWLPRFLQQHPAIGLELLSGDADTLSRGVDAAIHIGPVSDETLTSVRIASLGEIACASPEFIDLKGMPPTPEELDATHCIGVFDAALNCSRQWRFQKRGRQLVIEPRARLTVGDMEGAIEAAVGGAGFVRVLDFAVHAQIAAGLLRTVLADWSVEIRHDVSVAYAKRKRMPPGLEAFICFIAELFPATSANASPYAHGSWRDERHSSEQLRIREA